MLATALTFSIGGSPYGLPGALLAGGLMLMLFASIRLRLRSKRALARIHAVVACLAIASAMAMGAYRAQLFWSATFDTETGALVLQRPVPMGEVTIPAHAIERITEVMGPARTWRGTEVRVAFQVHTRDGRSYWSAPTTFAREATRTRATLQTASKGRVERFRIGGAALVR